MQVPAFFVRLSESLECTAGILCPRQMCFNIPDYAYTGFEASVFCWHMWLAGHVCYFIASAYASRPVLFLFWVVIQDNPFCAEFQAIRACLNFWQLGGAPASGAGPPPRLFGGTSKATYEFHSCPRAVFRILTLAHLAGVCDRGLPLVVL